MLKHLQRKIPFITVIFLLVGLNLAFVWSLNHAGHNMHPGSPMIGCMMMLTENSFCPMNLIDHIREWKGVTVMTENISWQQLLLLVVFSLLFIWSIRNFTPHGALSPGQRLIQKVKEKNIRASFYLSEFFSRGILHPKIFPSSFVVR